MMDQTWILCRSKPNQQRWAVENIARVRPDYECYLPRWYDPDLRKIAYMFGTYMFVRVIERQWHCLSGIWGLAYVMTNNEGACAVKDAEIDGIRKLEDRTGVVKIKLKRLEPGAEVRIVAGPLQFTFGRFIKHSRKGFVRVSIDGLLGKSTPVELEERSISPV